MAVKKVMISLPEEALARIDGEARRRGQTRSAFLHQAAEGTMPARVSPAELQEILARGRARLAHARGTDVTADIRRDRDERDFRNGRPR